MSVIEQITREAANELLRPMDMRIGEWHRLGPLSRPMGEGDTRGQIASPRDAKELMRLAYNAVDWLSNSKTSDRIRRFDIARQL